MRRSFIFCFFQLRVQEATTQPAALPRRTTFSGALARCSAGGPRNHQSFCTVWSESRHGRPTRPLEAEHRRIVSKAAEGRNVSYCTAPPRRCLLPDDPDAEPAAVPLPTRSGWPSVATAINRRERRTKDRSLKRPLRPWFAARAARREGLHNASEPARQISPLLNGDHLSSCRILCRGVTPITALTGAAPHSGCLGGSVRGLTARRWLGKGASSGCALIYRQLWLRLPAQSQFSRHSPDEPLERCER